MRSKLILSAVLSAAAMFGCDKKEDLKTSVPPPGARPNNPAPANDGMGKVDVMGNDAAKAAGDIKTNGLNALGDAKQTMVAQAQQMYDQAKQFIDSKNFASAKDLVGKLEGLQDKLPAEWGQKITELRTMLNNAMPGPATQPG